jgi:STAS domain
MLVMPSAPSRADVEALREQVREMTDGDGTPICDLGNVAEPDADTIDAMARLQLVALRVGSRFRFSEACEELRDLLALTGLSDVLPCDAPCGPPPRERTARRSGVEPIGQAEQREQALRIEKERDSRDPPV